MALNKSVGTLSVVAALVVAAGWLATSGLREANDPAASIVLPESLSVMASDPAGPQAPPASEQDNRARPPRVNRQNEFAADDESVQRVADEHAAKEGSSDRDQEFAQTYRDLAERFSGEPTTQAGTKLQSEILNRITEHTGAAPVAVQMECRQTICRAQLASSDEPAKSKTMEDITGHGEFRQHIGADKPVGGGVVVSDVYLVIKH